MPIYYELHDLLHEASSGLDHDIASAMKEGMKKYKKYYTFMDESDAYYTALVLDPRVKGDLILSELEDKEAGDMILTAIRENLHQKYLPQGNESTERFQRLIPCAVAWNQACFNGYSLRYLQLFLILINILIALGLA